MIDNSIANPGPMGWWENPADSLQSKLKRESRLYESLAMELPEYVSRHPRKDVVNPSVLGHLRKIMESQGEIEDGFSGRWLYYFLKGGFPAWLRQLIGSCVASGGMRVTTLRSLVEVVLLGQPESTLGSQMTGAADNINHFAPYSYRAGRKIGGLNGMGDGSFCGAHIEGLMRYGALPCNTPGLDSDAYPEPQSTRAYKAWGASDVNLQRFAQAERFALKESERVTDVASLWELLTEHFKPMMVCSNWAFRPDYQHPTWKIMGKPVWIYKRDTSNSWGHNMSKTGGLKHDGREYVEITNSWGDQAHKNGDYFIIPLDLEEQWLRRAEVRTIGDMELRDAELPIGW